MSRWWWRYHPRRGNVNRGACSENSQERYQAAAFRLQIHLHPIMSHVYWLVTLPNPQILAAECGSSSRLQRYHRYEVCQERTPGDHFTHVPSNCYLSMEIIAVHESALRAQLIVNQNTSGGCSSQTYRKSSLYQIISILELHCSALQYRSIG